jgi:hypothetical protein
VWVRAWLSRRAAEGVKEAPSRLCDRFVTCPSKALVCRGCQIQVDDVDAVRAAMLGMRWRSGEVSEVSEVWCGAGADADGDRGEGIVCSPFCRVRVVDGWINYIAGERADEAARVGPGREPMLIIDVGPGWQTLGAAERAA